MSKKIMKPSLANGAFVEKGDRVEFEVPHSTESITVLAVEINLKSGEAIIHGVGDNGHQWIVPARNLITVFNKKLTLKEEL